MRMTFFSSSTTIERTSAGFIALITKVAISSSQGIMSTRSSFNSLVTVWIREPRIPTQAPTGSRLGMLARTAILARDPGSRAAAMISIISWPISGTSSFNSSISKLESVRLIIICGPRPPSIISFK